MEESLRKRNIPYKIYGGLSFYERKEIKDILAYMRMLLNPNDEEALKRTINYPKRGIGTTTLERIIEASHVKDISPWAIISNPGHDFSILTPSTWKRIETYSNLIAKLTHMNEGANAYDAARMVIAETGIGRELTGGQTPEEVSRYENMQELLNAIKEFTEAAETNGEPTGLDSYLATVSLLTDMDTEGDEDRNKVTLMTIHSAKGLEFRNVYVAGLEENLFPSIMSLGTDKEIEEERRLFYVALTRAMENATLSFARNRYKWGNLESCRPSRFISEIEEKFIEYVQNTGLRFNVGGSSVRESNTVYRRPGTKPTNEIVKPPSNLKKISRENKGENDFSYTPSIGELKIGDRVSHERFGNGIIKSIDGKPPNTTAVVDFAGTGEKKLLLRFAKLKIRD